MKRKINSYLTLSVAFFAIFLVFTALLLTVDIRPIGPESSEVGLASINEYMLKLQTSIPESLKNAFYIVSQIGAVASIIIVCGFALNGAVQLFSGRSFKKVKAYLYLLGGLYIVLLLIYMVYEINVINYRPVLVDGELEASYPSSHTILTACVMFTAAFVLSRKYNKRGCRVILYLTAFIATFLTESGRLLSCVHWFTDIIGALVLSCGLIFLFIYLYFLFADEK